MNTKDLLKSVLNKDTYQAKDQLDQIMRDKIKTEIDLQKIQTASAIFNEGGEENLEEKRLIDSKDFVAKTKSEGNEFTKAAAKAVIDGEDEFEFNGKTYKATIDKKAAKAILGVEEANDSIYAAVKTKETTIDKFFFGYFGTKNWGKDRDFKDQIDMMNLGNKEIADLIKNKNKKVKVTSSSSMGGWITYFDMPGYTVEVESMDPVTEFV